jgi:chaperonin GroES
MAATATKRPRIKVNLQPIGDRIVVQRDESEERTSGGIVLPDTAKDKPTRGVVLAVGTGRLLNDGTRSTMQLRVGNRIIFTSYAPDELQIGEDKVLLMREEDVLAVIED